MNMLYIIKVKICVVIKWHIGSLNCVDYSSLEWLSYFKHIIQSLCNTCLFGLHSCDHIKPHLIEIKVSNLGK
jgi:hypothetical protein